MDNSDLIKQRFPGRILLTLSEVCEVLGISAQTAHNRISSGKFALKTLKQNNRTYIHFNEIVGYLDRLVADCAKPVARRRGRPSKAEQKVRQAAQA